MQYKHVAEGYFQTLYDTELEWKDNIEATSDMTDVGCEDELALLFEGERENDMMNSSSTAEVDFGDNTTWLQKLELCLGNTDQSAERKEPGEEEEKEDVMSEHERHLNARVDYNNWTTDCDTLTKFDVCRCVGQYSSVAEWDEIVKKLAEITSRNEKIKYVDDNIAAARDDRKKTVWSYLAMRLDLEQYIACRANRLLSLLKLEPDTLRDLQDYGVDTLLTVLKSLWEETAATKTRALEAMVSDASHHCWSVWYHHPMYELITGCECNEIAIKEMSIRALMRNLHHCNMQNYLMSGDRIVDDAAMRKSVPWFHLGDIHMKQQTYWSSVLKYRKLVEGYYKLVNMEWTPVQY